MFFRSSSKPDPVPFPYKYSVGDFDRQKHSFNGAEFVCMKRPVASSENKKNKGFVKARVLIVHGFSEHTLLYTRVMDYLSRVGIESFVFDQRGSGQTSPGKLKGLTDESHTFQDLDHFIEWNLEDKSKETPLFLFGHSMGGGIILNYGCSGRYRDQIAGIACTGPLVILHPHSAPRAIVSFLSPVIALLLPRFRIDTGLDLNATTSDAQYREFLSRDPLTVPLYGSLRQIYDFLERGKRLARDKTYVAKFQTPVLIMHGQEDQINDPKGSQMFYDICTVSDKQLKFIPKARHSLCLEEDAIFEDMADGLKSWILEHATQRP
ncbi:LANO_0D06172g1_1 [Lachancea nothofagi CBS 11611]|uniref:LANO_0D06172g1_1 n=1 Tax=Lachancea nothofagi CBS 11611 TaxID=1266666 RepID=A0A1G4JHN5_9SACH|nr:LANO_0D06172g1_1 [Lachancea nothofagi CBS 11611]